MKFSTGKKIVETNSWNCFDMHICSWFVSAVDTKMIITVDWLRFNHYLDTKLSRQMFKFQPKIETIQTNIDNTKFLTLWSFLNCWYLIGINSDLVLISICWYLDDCLKLVNSDNTTVRSHIIFFSFQLSQQLNEWQ